MSDEFDPERPHRRRNALTGEWVLVSPHRMKRPWQGRIETPAPEERPAHDPSCYLCPRNERAGGERNPDYDGPWAFTNDYASLTATAASSFRLPASRERRPGSGAGAELLMAVPESGTARVICFSPRHDLTLPEMDVAGVRAIVDLWAREYEELGTRDDVAWVQIFENKGELMGCSNPHPHGQIWAQSSIPGEPAKEDAMQRAHFEQHGRTLLADYLALELEQRERIVVENEAFVALIPFWAVWPFELLVVSREPRASLLDLSDPERTSLADMLKRVTTRYDNLFETSFPYSMGIHQLPASSLRLPDHSDVRSNLEAGSRKLEAESWHFHLHFYPPLLRSATVKKFMVGYEMLGEPQRDLTPEAAAQRLRDVSEVHYRRSDS